MEQMKQKQEDAAVEEKRAKQEKLHCQTEGKQKRVKETEAYPNQQKTTTKKKRK